ncbi:MAG: hypothetical protein WKH68_02860 [Candidatus Limnocylindria bacterium]
MNITAAAAIAFAIAAAGVIRFQMALALGVPWGSYAMGGAFPGKFPPRMRVAALVQAVLLAGTVAIVLSRAGLVLPAWSGVVGWLIWGVVALAVIAAILNAITPSAGERRIWVPVALVMLVSSLVVALAP